LKLAHSKELADQQKASVELSKFVSGTVLPAVSFGPLAHALCCLVANENNTVATYASRALKILLLDDALRSQVVNVGIPRKVVEAAQFWTDSEDVPTLRELMGALQTLTWDKTTASPTIEAGIIPIIADLLPSLDLELQTLVLAVAANLLSFADTLLLENGEAVQTFRQGVSLLLEIVKSRKGAARYYAVAGLANASAHPILAGEIKNLQGINLMLQVEKECMENLNISSNKLAESVQTALCHLKGEKSASCLKKYTSKWGAISSMELSLSFGRHKKWLKICGVLWIVLIIYLFFPLFLDAR